MHLHLQFAPILALIAGIALLIAPKHFRYIVAAYFIVVGLMGLI